VLAGTGKFKIGTSNKAANRQQDKCFSCMNSKQHKAHSHSIIVPATTI